MNARMRSSRTWAAALTLAFLAASASAQILVGQFVDLSIVRQSGDFMR